MSTCWTWTDSPLGRVLLTSDGLALTGVYFADQKYFPQPAPAGKETPQAEPFPDAVRQLDEYFAGSRRVFDLPLAPRGTAFQHAVWHAIAAIPPGETVGYGTLAQRLARPKAARAVGAATGRNPLSVVVPCHRVVGAAGQLTGYAGGLARKRALLALEGGQRC